MTPYEQIHALHLSLSGRRMNKCEYIKTCSDALRITVNRLVEVGVNRGGGAAAFRRVYPDATLYLVDPWRMYDAYQEKGSGNVYKGRTSDARQNKCLDAYLNVQSRFLNDINVRIFRASSQEAAGDFKGPFDIVFLDGNHSYEYVRSDITAWLPLVRAGGILCGHDYKRFSGVRRAVTELLSPVLISGQNKGDVWVFPR